MIDFHLAELYQVETRALKQAVKRNLDRFPADDFMFSLTKEEAEMVLAIGVSQNVIPPNYNFGATSPMAFSEAGIAMLSSVLKSQIAELFGVYISAVTMNLKSIRKEDEVFVSANRTKVSYQTASGEYYHSTPYNLDIIILLAFKMTGGNCHLFRQWMRKQVKRPIVKSRQRPIVIQIGQSTSLN